MRFIDFITWQGFKCLNAEKLEKTLSSFFLSHSLRPYTEVIKRNDKSNAFFKSKIKPLLQRYAQAIFVNQEKSHLDSSSLHPDTQEILHLTREIVIQRHSHNPEALSIAQEMMTLVIVQGRNFLLLEHQAANTAAFEIYCDTGKFISYDEYKALLFKDNFPNTDTLQQFLSYLSFTQSIIYPFSQLTHHTINRKKAIEFMAASKALETVIEKYHAEVEKLILEIESIERRLYRYSQYFQQHSNDLHPHGNVAECMATVSYQGIVSLWKELNQYQELEKIYQEKQAQYLDLLQFMSKNDGVLDTNNRFLQTIFNNLEHWYSNSSDRFNRQADLKALHLIANHQQRTRGHDVIYRNIEGSEKVSLVQSKQFTQWERSLEREKWFYIDGGSPGHSADYPYRCKIYLKAGSLHRLKELQKADGQRAALVSKVNEAHCIGVHEDALPFLNNLISQVEIFHNKGSQQRTDLIIFTPSMQDLSPMIDNPRVQVDYSYLLPSPRILSQEADQSVIIDTADEEEFEEWLERAMTVDPLTGRQDSPDYIRAIPFALQIHLHGDTLQRYRLTQSANSLTLRTFGKDYQFSLKPMQQNSWTLAKCACTNKTDPKRFVQVLSIALAENTWFVRDLIIKSMSKVFSENRTNKTIKLKAIQLNLVVENIKKINKEFQDFIAPMSKDEISALLPEESDGASPLGEAYKKFMHFMTVTVARTSSYLFNQAFEKFKGITNKFSHLFGSQQGQENLPHKNYYGAQHEEFTKIQARLTEETKKLNLLAEELIPIFFNHIVRHSYIDEPLAQAWCFSSKKFLTFIEESHANYRVANTLQGNTQISVGMLPEWEKVFVLKKQDGTYHPLQLSEVRDLPSSKSTQINTENTILPQPSILHVIDIDFMQDMQSLFESSYQEYRLQYGYKKVLDITNLANHFSFFRRSYESYITENRHNNPNILKAYNERFGIVLKR